MNSGLHRVSRRCALQEDVCAYRSLGGQAMLVLMSSHGLDGLQTRSVRRRRGIYAEQYFV